MDSLISIIMPMCNAERFVGDAIQSVLDQTHKNWELLIVNDGSTDNSLREVEKYPDERITLFSQNNRGVSVARNLALANMRGEYFCFLDADDVFPPNSLEARLSRFDKSVYFVDGTVETFDERMMIKIKTWQPRINGNVGKNLFRLDNRCFFGLTWLIRRDWDFCYRFDETITHGEDLLFLMCIAHSGDYTYTPNVILNYRKSESSAMQNAYGLGNGYTMVRKKMHALFKDRISLVDRMIFDFKVRKIMLIIFSRDWRLWLALRYLILGRL